jgi:hypothetical protein
MSWVVSLGRIVDDDSFATMIGVMGVGLNIEVMRRKQRLHPKCTCESGWGG